MSTIGIFRYVIALAGMGTQWSYYGVYFGLTPRSEGELFATLIVLVLFSMAFINKE